MLEEEKYRKDKMILKSLVDEGSKILEEFI